MTTLHIFDLFFKMKASCIVARTQLFFIAEIKLSWPHEQMFPCQHSPVSPFRFPPASFILAHLQSAQSTYSVLQLNWDQRERFSSSGAQALVMHTVVESLDTKSHPLFLLFVGRLF